MPHINNTKAVILAAGKGTRFYPITYEIPKAFLRVRKKPIINYLIDLFHSCGIFQIGVLGNISFKDEFEWWKKRYYSSKNTKIKIKIIYDKKEPSGTFGGLKLFQKWIGDSFFFVTNGDELKKIDLNRWMKFHQKKDFIATIALARVQDPQHYGVAVCDKNSLIKKFLEKPKNPPSNYISSGTYLFSPKIFEYYPRKKNFSMLETDLFPLLTEEKKLGGFKFRGKWLDCGTWERYEKALKEWK